MFLLNCIVFGILLLICNTNVNGNDENNVVNLTSSVFDEEIQRIPHFVLFDAPLSLRCRKFSPIWKQLAKKFNKRKGQKVVISKIDCSIETDFCYYQKLDDYPKLKFFYQNNTHVYNENLDEAKLDDLKLMPELTGYVLEMINEYDITTPETQQSKPKIHDEL